MTKDGSRLAGSVHGKVEAALAVMSLVSLTGGEKAIKIVTCWWVLNRIQETGTGRIQHSRYILIQHQKGKKVPNLRKPLTRNVPESLLA